MKKQILIILGIVCLIVFVIFFCNFCGFFEHRQYICDIEQVESISIVKLGKHVVEERRFDYTVISEITDLTAFVERLNNITQSEASGMPMLLYEDYVVIKIDYLNGDYDLIHDRAQRLHRAGENNFGYFYFEEKELQQLISDYT